MTALYNNASHAKRWPSAPARRKPLIKPSVGQDISNRSETEDSKFKIGEAQIASVSADF
jgi:hypothetical protein